MVPATFTSILVMGTDSVLAPAGSGLDSLLVLLLVEALVVLIPRPFCSWGKMTYCATPKASAGISSMVTTSGIHVLKPPDDGAAGAGGASTASSGLLSSSGMELVLQIHQILKNFVARADRLRIRFKTTLRGNQVRKLAGQIHVRHF